MFTIIDTTPVTTQTTPVGNFERFVAGDIDCAHIASVVASVFAAPIVIISIGGHSRMWFPLGEQLHDSLILIPGSNLSTHLEAGPRRSRRTRVRAPFGRRPPAPDDVDAGPYTVADVSSDERTRTHPWAQGPDRIRFFAAAPVIGSDGRRIGTLEVMDRIRHRRIGRQQLRTLGHLSALTAQLLQAERRLR